MFAASFVVMFVCSAATAYPGKITPCQLFSGFKSWDACVERVKTLNAGPELTASCMTFFEGQGIGFGPTTKRED